MVAEFVDGGGAGGMGVISGVGFDFVVLVVECGCAVGFIIGVGREGENTESCGFSDEERGGGAGIFGIGGRLGFRAAGVVGLLGLLGEGGGEGEEEEG